MCSLRRKLKTAQRYVAAMLLSVMVYQLGACPCGCHEHNAWARFLGIGASGDNVQVVVGGHGGRTAAVTSSHDTHDCTGEARALYFNNTRSPSVQKVFVAEESSSSMVVAGLTTLAVAADATRYRTESRTAFAAVPRRPALQVYRL